MKGLINEIIFIVQDPAVDGTRKIADTGKPVIMAERDTVADDILEGFLRFEAVAAYAVFTDEGIRDVIDVENRRINNLCVKGDIDDSGNAVGIKVS